MDKALKTTKKRPAKPFNGSEGKVFSTDNQPSPEAKKQGWEERRAQKLLTQKIIEKMTSGKKLDDYVEALYKAAVMGNAKAIDTINKGIEDQIEQSQVDHKGLEPIIIEWKK